jgi:hypothetical protein
MFGIPRDYFIQALKDITPKPISSDFSCKAPDPVMDE